MTNRIRTELFCLAVPILAASLATASAAQTSPGIRSGTRKCLFHHLSLRDRSFLKTVNGANLAEPAFTPVVLRKSTNDSVKAYARQMTHDHNKANDLLVILAAKKGVALPGVVPAKEQAAIHQLAQLEGPPFDRTYKQDMIADHVQAIALFNDEVKKGSDPDVVAYASNTLPTLHMHLQMAQDLLK